ncbi:MAG: VWA-like domain-containing protein [Chitinispirillales bacterium]|jgi:predicted metal-dependent peptidase|nr:VWA-like domain-containing protein [Chitinispirillales bacterium]
MKIASVKYKAMPFEYKLARFSLLLRKAYPFLGELSMRVNKYRKDINGIAATDGKNLYLNEKLMNELPEECLNFVLLHEILHIILRHIFPKDMPYYAKMYWNIGYDLVVNWLIMRMEYELKRNELPVQPISDTFMTQDDLSGDPSHRIAESFIEQAKDQGILSAEPPMTVKLKWKSFETEVTNDGSYVFDILEQIKNSLDEAEVQGLLASCSKAAGNTGLPYFIKGLLEDIADRRKLPWFLLVKQYLEMAKDNDDYTFCPPDKRMLYSGLILPVSNDEEKALNNALIVIDVSSSVGREELSAQIWQVACILKDLDFTGSIISFGSEVYQEAPVTDKFSLGKFVNEMNVGGGTDWADVVEYVKKHKKGAKPIIVFTDGQFYSFEKGLSDVIFITQYVPPGKLRDLGKVIMVSK